jgi:GNAT superfamily N-acetyltransferase
MTGVQLRRALPGDGPAAADVYLRARHAAVPAIPPLVHDDADVHRWMASVLAHDETWLAQEGQEVVGLLVLTPGWIEHLYLAPERQGGGVGSRLLSLARDCQPHGLELWTFAANQGARRFYERQGFEAVEHTDGAGNEERAPDVRYHWPGAAAAGA